MQKHVHKIDYLKCNKSLKLRKKKHEEKSDGGFLIMEYHVNSS